MASAGPTTRWLAFVMAIASCLVCCHCSRPVGGAHSARLQRNLQQIRSGGLWSVGEWSLETLIPPSTPNISMIAAAEGSCMALRADGQVEGFGPLFPARASVFKPRRKVVAMEVGRPGSSTATSSLFLLDDGTLQDYTTQCVLFNENFCSRLNPVPDAAQSDVVGIAVGTQFSYAVKRNGSVVEWHFILSSADTKSNFNTASLADVAKLAVNSDTDGAEYGVVLFNNKTVATRGPTYGTLPAEATSGGVVTDVAAGGRHGLAIISPGKVIAWGENDQGQTNVPAAAQASVVKVAAGGAHSLALLGNGTVVCWGGNAASRQCAIPASVRSSRVLDIKAGTTHSIALLQGGTVATWGVVDLFSQQASVPPATRSGIVQVSAGTSHDVVLTQEGKMLGFGDNAYNQLTLPEALQGRRFTDVSVGAHHTLLVLGSTELACLGTTCNIPAQLPPVLKAAAGDEASCVLHVSGSVSCWNHLVPTSTTGEAFSAVEGWDMAAVASGVKHIALERTSSTRAFAAYDNNTVVEFSSNPAQVVYQGSPPGTPGAAVTKLAAAPWYVLVLLENNTVAYGTTQSIFASGALPVPDSIQGQVVSMSGNLAASMYVLRNGSTVIVSESSGDCKPPPVATLDVSLAAEQPSSCRYLALVDSNALAAFVQSGATITPSPVPSPPATNRSTTPSLTPSPSNPSASGPVTPAARGVNIDPVAAPLDTSSPSSSSSKKVSIGAVIGAVVGGVCLLALLVAGLLLWRRRRSAAQSQPSGSDYKPAGGAKAWPGSADSSDVFGYTAQSRDQMVASTTWGNPLWGTAVVAANPRSGIAGIAPGELFGRTTALDYSWATLTCPPAQLQVIEAGVNDAQLDGMLKGRPGPVSSADCPVVQLTKEQLRQQVHLLPDGLLGKGATAVAFSCVWPSRFGPDALLAVKVLKDGHDSHVAELESFAYEASILTHARHPNVVRMYGFCLEPPNVCLILELLQTSMKDVLTHSRSLGSTGKPASGFDWSSIGKGGSSKGGAHPGDASTGVSSTGASGDGAANQHSRSGLDTLDQHGAVVRVTAAPAEALKAPSVPVQALSPAASAAAPLNMERVLNFSLAIAAGLAYLHDIPLDGDKQQEDMQRTASGEANDPGSRQNRIVHRDMKPANVLLNSRGQAKISDFGLARQHDSTTICTEHVGAGTLSYMAPELLIGSYGGYKQNITNKVDIYSMSIIMYELITTDHPWKGLNELALVAAVTGGKRPHLPTDRPGQDDTQVEQQAAVVRPGVPLSSVPVSLYAWPEFNAIIRMCWQHRESKRPTAKQLLRMLRELQAKHQETSDGTEKVA